MTTLVLVGHTAEGDPFAGRCDLGMLAESGERSIEGVAPSEMSPMGYKMPKFLAVAGDPVMAECDQQSGPGLSLSALNKGPASVPLFSEEPSAAPPSDRDDTESPGVTQMLIDALRAEMADALTEVVAQLGQLREGLEVLKVLRDPGARDDLTIAALDVLADIESSLAHRAAVYAGGASDEPGVEEAQV